jgi:hypothetical protein
MSLAVHSYIDEAALVGAFGTLIVALTGMAALLIRSAQTHRMLQDNKDLLHSNRKTIDTIYDTVNCVERDVDGAAAPGEEKVTLGQRARRMERDMREGFDDNRAQHEVIVGMVKKGDVAFAEHIAKGKAGKSRNKKGRT